MTCDPSGLAEEFMWVSEGGESVQVMTIADGEFEGDTVFALPGGGTVNVVRRGGDMEVEVEATASQDPAAQGQMENQVTVTRTEGADGEIRIEKRVIVVRED